MSHPQERRKGGKGKKKAKKSMDPAFQERRRAASKGGVEGGIEDEL